MKIKLTLSRTEYEGFATILRNLYRVSNIESFEDYCYLLAIEELVYKMLPKLQSRQLKNKNRLCLNSIQTLAMYKLLNRYTAVFKLYEEILSTELVEKINLQFHHEMGLRNKIN